MIEISWGELVNLLQPPMAPMIGGAAPSSSPSARLGPPIKPCDPRPVPDLSFGKVAPQIAARPPVTATRQAVRSVMQHWPSRPVLSSRHPWNRTLSTLAPPKKGRGRGDMIIPHSLPQPRQNASHQAFLAEP